MKEDRFPERTRLAMDAREAGKSFAAIAADLGISQQRVRQIVLAEEQRRRDRGSRDPLRHMTERDANRVRSGLPVRGARGSRG